jgi:outer membrane receptor for ferrienterochelin and colicins
MKNIIKSILLIGFTLIISLNAFTQVKTDAMLFGGVKSKASGEHIPFANIIVKGTNIGTSTDASGHYKMANLPTGKQIIIASAIGYKAQEKEVVMFERKAVNLFFELEEDILQLEQVVVTGTRTEHYIKDVPVRTEVITAKEIESKNARNLYQVLEGMPGIRVEKQCQFCNFTLIRMQGLGAEHTQVLINGHPIYSGLAGVYGLQQIGTIDIDRIEVVKGAGSALYGSSAVAGAINIITKEPALEPSTKADLQFGEYRTNNYGISSSIRNEKGNIGLNVYAQQLTGDVIDETSDGISRDQVESKDGISDRVATNLNSLGFGLYFTDIFSQDDKVILRGRSLYEKRQGGIINDDYYRNPLTDGTERINTKRYESELSYHIPFKNHSDLNISLAYSNHNRDATNDSYLCDYMGTHHDSVPDLRNMRPYLARENSLTSTLTFGTKIRNHQLLIGTQVYRNKLEESGMYIVVDHASAYFSESYRSLSHKDAIEFGLFIQDEWSVNEKFAVVPGVRLDKHNSREEYKADRQIFETILFPVTEFKETSVNPRIALKYEVSKRIILRANTGTGFRAPYGFSEDLHLCSGSPRIWKSSGLKPEKSVSYNFSADYYGSKLWTSINLFRTDLKNKIGFTSASPNISSLGYDYQWENIDNAFVQGIEASVMLHVFNALKFGVDFTCNQGKYDHIREDWKVTPYAEMSKHISRFPRTTGNIKIEYDPKNWNFVLSGNYQGKMYIDYFNEAIDPEIGDQTKIKITSPFMLFNTRFSRKINVFKIFAGINNISGYVQDEKHTDDAAFIYAPVYGTLYYGGISIDLRH